MRTRKKLLLSVFFVAAALIASGIGWYGERRSEVMEVQEYLSDSLFQEFFGEEYSFAEGGIWSAFRRYLESGLGEYGLSREVLSAVVRIGKDLERLEEGFPDIFYAEGELLSTLRSLRESMSAVGEAVRVSGGSVLGFPIDTARGIAFLDSLISWLDSEEPRRLAVFFQNSAEIRSTGGFWGSFADITLEKGSIVDLEVRDVNEPDRFRTARVVPPRPLQRIVSSWRVADANWFLDFPSSARKAIQFLEESSLYEGSGVDGVGTLSSRVVEELLAITGPVTLADGAELNSSNLMRMIQESIEEHRAEGEDDPKRILGDTFDAIMARVRSLDREGKARIMNVLAEGVRRRDILLFVEDETFGKFLSESGVDGGQYVPPDELSGDYFAITFSNIGGMKTDLVMFQEVSFESRISGDGIVTDRLTTRRTHGGEDEEESWYRAENQSYVRLYTPLGADLVSASGGSRVAVSPRVDYSSGGYVNDPDVREIERTAVVVEDFPSVTRFIELGKNVFSTWLLVPRGETKTVVFEYSRRLPEPPVSGGTYTFVFEPQPGLTAIYRVSIAAPPGYIWLETGSPGYEYESADPSGREVVTLTLRRR